MSEDVVVITDANFDAEVTKAIIPVLVAFGAAWSSPSRLLSPVINELAKEYKGKVKVGKLDTEENNATSAKFDITVDRIPTTILFKNGKAVKKIIGLKSKQDIKGEIDSEDVVVITNANFDAEVTKAAVPVLVLFWAGWSGPSIQMLRVIGELAKEYKGKVKVGKLDTEENNATYAKFDITVDRIPTIILFKNGKAVSEMFGVKSKECLKREIDMLLK